MEALNEICTYGLHRKKRPIASTKCFIVTKSETEGEFIYCLSNGKNLYSW